MLTTLKTLIENQNRFFKKLFGETTGNFIVDSTHPSPTGVKYYKLQVLVTTADLEIKDSSLATGSSTLPAILTAGTILYGIFSNVSVSAGTIKLYNI